MLHELKPTIIHFHQNTIHEIIHNLKRISCITKHIVSQVDILETMSPESFASFRQYLGTASGFQSEQFRTIEFTLGIRKIDDKLECSEIFSQNTLWSAFLICYKKFYEEKYKNIQKFENLNEIKSLLVTLYYQRSIYTEIGETLLDIDEKLQEWRYRHVKLVERIIGSRTYGTGGSEGFEYLKKTITKSFCHELWNIRGAITTNTLQNYFEEKDQILL